jgi:hypothetical protein
MAGDKKSEILDVGGLRNGNEKEKNGKERPKSAEEGDETVLKVPKINEDVSAESVNRIRHVITLNLLLPLDEDPLQLFARIVCCSMRSTKAID